MSIFRSGRTLALLLFIFAFSLLTGGPTSRFDLAAMESLEKLAQARPALVDAASVLTRIGGAPATMVTVFAAALVMIVRRRWLGAIALVGCALAERAAVDGMKLWIARPRPLFDHPGAAASSFAFPSGHSANALALYLMVAITVSPIAWRRPAILLAMSLGLLSGLTRPVLGVHWPSDVVGGWAFALIAFWLYCWAGERSGLLSFEQQHEVVGRHGAALDETEAMR